MTSAKDWRDVYCGRKAELQQLVAAYEAVAEGGGPRLAVVCAERGMGKTRLVQEFYRHLSTAHDPDDYWPDASLFQGNNLRVAPDFNDPQTQAHFAAFTTAERPMPFLWWGFRLHDPLDRNAVRSDMAAHRRTLDPHLERARFAREHAARHAAIQHSAKDTAKDAALKIGEALLESVPGVGLGKNLVEVGLGMFKTARAHREAQREREAFASADLAALESRRVEDLYERTLEDMAALLEPADGLGSIPAVVFCDDAQFARDGGDEGALHFLQRLWERAERSGWPLLLLVTHWEVDWEQDQKAAGPSFARAFGGQALQPSAATVISLSKPAELVDLVRGALPQLPGADADMLVAKADGNPQVLIELIDRVKVSPAWRAPDGALSALGRKKILAHSCNLTSLITERLLSDATPPEVRVALAIASVQGMQFLSGLTEAAAQQLALGEAAQGLVAAESPLRLIVGVQEGVASFVQRAYREAATALVESQLGDPEDIKRGVFVAALQLVEPGDAWERLPPDHRKSLLGVVASLGTSSKDSGTRLQGAKALVRLLALDSDTASRARHARTLVDGMTSQWSITQFETSEIDSIGEALDDWDGLHASARFDEQGVQTLRPAAAADPVAQGRRFIHLLFRLAEHRGWQYRDDEAAVLIDEAIDTARTLRRRDPDFHDGALAAVIRRAGGIWGQSRVREDEVARWEAEELDLRRAHFDAAADVPTCEALVAALGRQASCRDAAEANALREEALVAARRLVAKETDSDLARCTLGTALMACLSPISSEGDVEFRLPSLDAAAAALPLIDELLGLGPFPPEVGAEIAHVNFGLGIVGAAAANRCGDQVMQERMLARSRAAGDIDATVLSAENRAQRWYLESIRALLEGDIVRATSFAQEAIRDAIASGEWYWVGSARAFAHRLAERHLLLLVEPDPTDEDRAAVLPDVLRDICADVPAWVADDAAAGKAFNSIEWLMRDAYRRDDFDAETVDALVHEVRRAFERFRAEHDREARSREVTLRWLAAIAHTLVLATRGSCTDDFEYLWQRMGGVYRSALDAERSVGELNTIYGDLSDLWKAVSERDWDRAVTLDHAMLPVLHAMAQRTGDPVDRGLLAHQLGMCAFACMRDDDLDNAQTMLDQAADLCAGLLAESASADNLNTLRRNLEAKETLARRRGDDAAEHEARLERRATLHRLVAVDDSPERQQELEELNAALAGAGAKTPALH